jgi:hypothetical protein
LLDLGSDLSFKTFGISWALPPRASLCYGLLFLSEARWFVRLLAELFAEGCILVGRRDLAQCQDGK